MTEEILPPPAIDVADASYVVTVEFKGHQFKLPASADDWPLDAIEAMEEGQLAKFVRQLLGSDQYGAFKTLRPTGGQIGDFVKDYLARIGSGNS